MISLGKTYGHEIYKEQTSFPVGTRRTTPWWWILTIATCRSTMYYYDNKRKERVYWLNTCPTPWTTHGSYMILHTAKVSTSCWQRSCQGLIWKVSSSPNSLTVISVNEISICRSNWHIRAFWTPLCWVWLRNHSQNSYWEPKLLMHHQYYKPNVNTIPTSMMTSPPHFSRSIRTYVRQLMPLSTLYVT